MKLRKYKDIKVNFLVVTTTLYSFLRWFCLWKGGSSSKLFNKNPLSNILLKKLDNKKKEQ